MDEDSFDASCFAKNKERLLEADVAKRFFERVVRQAAGHGLMSKEHFTVDGTLIEAWASVKSFKRRDKTKGEEPPTTLATRRWISTARSAATRRTSSTTETDGRKLRRYKQRWKSNVSARGSSLTTFLDALGGEGRELPRLRSSRLDL